MKPRLTAYFYLLIVSVIWGAASPVVKFTLQWFDPWLFLTYRFLISSMIAIPYFALTKTKIPKKSGDFGLMFLTSLLSAPVALGLFFLALTKTTALSASLLTAGAPLLLVLSGALFFHDRITHTEKTGIAITVVGTLVTAFGPLFLNGHVETLGRLEGNILMIGAAGADIAAAVLSKAALRRGIHAAFLAQSQFIVGLLIFLPLLLLSRSPSSLMTTILAAPPEAHLGVLFMAVLSGTLAYTLRNVAIKTIEVSESALFSYLQPLWAAILAVLWLKESMTPSYVIGGMIIATGVVIAEYKKRKNKKKRRWVSR